MTNFYRLLCNNIYNYIKAGKYMHLNNIEKNILKKYITNTLEGTLENLTVAASYFSNTKNGIIYFNLLNKFKKVTSEEYWKIVKILNTP